MIETRIEQFLRRLQIHVKNGERYVFDRILSEPTVVLLNKIISLHQAGRYDDSSRLVRSFEPAEDMTLTLDTSVFDSPLDMRTATYLEERLSITTLGELAVYPAEKLEMSNGLGEVAIRQIREVLAEAAVNSQVKIRPHSIASAARAKRGAAPSPQRVAS